MSIARVLLLVALPLATTLGMPLSQEYNHSVFMDPEEKFQVHWSIRGDKIHFAVQVNTTGWVGLGIAKGLAGKMEGADIVIGYVRDGTGYLTDRHATGNSRPIQDESQDYELESAEENNGQTILKFNRKTNTCDQNDNHIVEGTMRVLYAYNDVDPTPDDETTIMKHTKRGSKSMNLRSYVKNSPVQAGAMPLDMLSKNVSVPAVPTVYWCTVFKMPDLGGKKHVIEMEPVVQPGHESLVHHIVVYGCGASVNDSHVNVSDHCHVGNMPPPVQECAGRDSVFAWAIGSKNFKFPDHVGMAIGDGEIAYYMMEVHYDNPSKSNQYVDSSGLRFHYTDELRKYDAGMMMVGAEVHHTMMIPPGQEQWRTHGYCHPECTMKLDAPDELQKSIRIFATIPHSHLAGRAIKSSIVRNYSETYKLVNDDSYDFNFQQSLLLEKEIPLRPGDGISTTCVYNTEDRTKVVTGGLGTNDEMCVVYIMYYPRQQLGACRSVNILIDQAFKPRHPTWSYAPAPWDKDMVDALRSVNSVKYSLAICKGRLGTPATAYQDVNFHIFKNPTIKNALPAPKSPCQGVGSGANGLTANHLALVSLTVVVINLLCSH